MDRQKVIVYVGFAIMLLGVLYTVATPSKYVLERHGSEVVAKASPAIGPTRTFYGITRVEAQAMGRSCALIVQADDGPHTLREIGKDPNCMLFSPGVERGQAWLKSPTDAPVILYESLWRRMGLPEIGVVLLICGVLFYGGRQKI